MNLRKIILTEYDQIQTTFKPPTNITKNDGENKKLYIYWGYMLIPVKFLHILNDDRTNIGTKFIVNYLNKLQDAYNMQFYDNTYYTDTLRIGTNVTKYDKFVLDGYIYSNEITDYDAYKSYIKILHKQLMDFNNEDTIKNNELFNYIKKDFNIDIYIKEYNSPNKNEIIDNYFK